MQRFRAATEVVSNHTKFVLQFLLQINHETDAETWLGFERKNGHSSNLNQAAVNC